MVFVSSLPRLCLGLHCQSLGEGWTAQHSPLLSAFGPAVVIYISQRIFYLWVSPGGGSIHGLMLMNAVVSSLAMNVELRLYLLTCILSKEKCVLIT